MKGLFTEAEMNSENVKVHTLYYNYLISVFMINFLIHRPELSFKKTITAISEMFTGPTSISLALGFGLLVYCKDCNSHYFV